MSTRLAWRSAVVVLLTAALLAGAPPSAAPARTSYCSPSGDLCYGAFGKGATVRLRITLFARYFTRYRLCVESPTGKTDCRRFSVRRAKGGVFGSSVRWSRRFPFRGPGRYRARWSASGRRLGPRVSFLEGPSIKTRPRRVRAGERVRVFGLAGGCSKGSQVTLTSEAFPSDNEFAGIPAVLATVDGNDSYSVLVRIPRERAPGRYEISARCGGANFGVQRRLTVLSGA